MAYTDWWLSDVSVLEKLAPNNWKVDAYYLTDEDGSVKNVYIYQNDMLIDELQNVGTFNTADCEQTEKDREIFVEQQKKIAGFNKWVADNAIDRLGVMKASLSSKSEDEDVEALELKPREEPKHQPLLPVSASSHAFSDL